jgi:hypothetical protein
MTLMKLVTTGHDKLQVWRRIQLMTERTINPCHVAISGKTPDLPDGESAEERGARSEERGAGERRTQSEVQRAFSEPVEHCFIDKQVRRELASRQEADARRD